MSFDKISQLCQVVIGGQILYKFDHIAIIHIDDRYFFNVYRRYNSPYNIIVEDYNNDVHLHQDYTLRTSLKTVLALSDSKNMYMCWADSFKHNGPILTDILDMRWTEIQSQFQAVNVNLSGVFDEPYQPSETIPSTPMNQTINPLTEPPPLVRYSSLAPLTIPEPPLSPKADPSDHPSMSLKYIDVKAGRGDKTSINCYCEYDDDSDDEASDEASDDESDEEMTGNYITLRSGTIINKNN